MEDYMQNVPIRKMLIKHVGVFDLLGLYRVMQRWFYDNGFYFEEHTTRTRNKTPIGYEHEFIWTGWRRVNDYVKYNIRVYFHLWDTKDIEVIKEGKKLKLTKCRLWLEFDGDVELDYTKRFHKSKFGKWLFSVYNRLILQEEKVLSNYWDQLYYRVYKLQTIAKEFLDHESRGNAFYDVW